MGKSKMSEENRLVVFILILLMLSLGLPKFIADLLPLNTKELNVFSGIVVLLTASYMLFAQKNASDEQQKALLSIKDAIDRNTAVQAKIGDVQQDDLKPFEKPSTKAYEKINQRLEQVLEENVKLNEKRKRLMDDDDNSINNNPMCCCIIKRKIKLNDKEMDKLVDWLDKLKH